jgi:hypothetical protein
MQWLDADLSMAALPVAASILTLWLSQWHSRRMAKDERKHQQGPGSRDPRISGPREARYADRRSATVGFIAAASIEADAVIRFEQEHLGLSPFDIHDDYLFPSLNGADAELAVVASPPVVIAATALRKAAFDCFVGSDDCWPAYTLALETFQEAARTMLAEDIAAEPPAPGG